MEPLNLIVHRQMRRAWRRPARTPSPDPSGNMQVSLRERLQSARPGL